MDPIRNPYAPGAGTPPPELAGRAEVIEAATVAIQRIAQGRPVQSQILVGLRGVGKTVLLNKLHEFAETKGFKSVAIEAHEKKTLPELLVPSIRSMLYSFSMLDSAKDKARRGLRALKGFLSGLQVRIGEVELGLSIGAEAGLADSGDLEADLPDLVEIVAEAARAAGRSISIFLDEMQYIHPKEFSALIMSIHRVNQRQLPLILVGAGLPQILGLAGNSKSYAERLFRFPEIGALTNSDARLAIINPAQAEGVTFEEAAIEKILMHTQRYPYFIQQWAHDAWNASDSYVISADTVEIASRHSIAELDQSFFKVRFDRCTPAERIYMRALAELGRGKHRSGDVAELLGVKVTSAAPTRNALIRKGMIYAPSHGDTAFTVPLFDDYMRRAMPNYTRRP